MTPYYLWMLCSALVCTAAYCRLARSTGHALRLSLTTLLFSSVLGVICAKLVYYVAQIDFMLADGWAKSLVNPDPAQWCFFGGGMGAVLGAYLAAKLTKVKPMTALNAFAPAAALMAALARFGGYFLQEDMIGLGAYMEDPALCFFPLTVSNEWGEAYLAVFMLEGLYSLVVTGVSLGCFKEQRFVRTLFYICLPQIFCESLHSDSISWLFVRSEQLFSMLVLAGVLVLYTVQMGPKPRRWLPMTVCLACAGLFVGLEFALDKSSWPIPLIYAAMVLGLVVLAVVECKAARKLRQAE